MRPVPGIVLAVCLLSPIWARAAGRIELLVPGDFHGSDVDHRPGPGWLALVDDRRHARLQPVALRYGWVRDLIVDDAPSGPYTGIRVRIRPEVDAIALFKGPGLSAGAVVPATLTGTAAGLTEKRLTVHGRRYTLRGDGHCRRTGDANFMACLWMLGDHRRRQVLTELTVETTPSGALTLLHDREVRLLWAGDLDANGRLDLLFDTSKNEAGAVELRLFLSSHAKPGDLVGEAGRFLASGC